MSEVDAVKESLFNLLKRERIWRKKYKTREGTFWVVFDYIGYFTTRSEDTPIKAVGIPATFELCQQLIAPGGVIANVGVHGKPADLHLETPWDRNIAITTRLVDTATIPMVFKTVAAKKIDPTLLITHHFTLADILQAYETFGDAARTRLRTD